jgi:hypothetical protein
MPYSMSGKPPPKCSGLRDAGRERLWAGGLKKIIDNVFIFMCINRKVMDK